jgi:hypothetical protein
MQHRVTCMVGAVLPFLGVAPIWLAKEAANHCPHQWNSRPSRVHPVFSSPASDGSLEESTAVSIPSRPGPAQRPSYLVLLTDLLLDASDQRGRGQQCDCLFLYISSSA